jgi:hypothetical protein
MPDARLLGSSVRKICTTDAKLLGHFACFVTHAKGLFEKGVFETGRRIIPHIEAQEGDPIMFAVSILRRRIEFRYSTCSNVDLKPVGFVGCYASSQDRSCDPFRFVTSFEFDEEGMVVGPEESGIEGPAAVTVEHYAAFLVLKCLAAVLTLRPTAEKP